MKRLLVFTNPQNEFTDENKTLVKIHIDNCLDLGIEPLLFTNFLYSYNGVTSSDVPCFDIPWDRTSNKIPIISYLLKEGVLSGLNHYADFDAYQNEPITDEEIGAIDLALTGYGYKDQVNGGSFFFRPEAKDMFDLWDRRLRDIVRTRADEKTMTDMLRRGELDPARYKLLNITYNFGQRCPIRCYEQAEKPLKILHFHPYYRFYPKDDTNINVFMHGHNPQGIPMMSERLIRIFKDHGVQ